MVPFVYSFKQVLCVWKVFIAKMSPKQNIDKVHHYFEKVEEGVVNSLNSLNSKAAQGSIKKEHKLVWVSSKEHVGA